MIASSMSQYFNYSEFPLQSHPTSATAVGLYLSSKTFQCLLWIYPDSSARGPLITWAGEIHEEWLENPRPSCSPSWEDLGRNSTHAVLLTGSSIHANIHPNSWPFWVALCGDIIFINVQSYVNLLSFYGHPIPNPPRPATSPVELQSLSLRVVPLHHLVNSNAV